MFSWLYTYDRNVTNMADQTDNVNNISRKRKSSDVYNNFGVDGLECSPSNSPEPTANTLKCSLVTETELIQTSTETTITKMEKEEISISFNVAQHPQQQQQPKSDDLRCMDMDVDDNQQTADIPDTTTTNKPFLSVIFHDNEFAIIFRSQIVNYIKSLVSFQLIEECKRENDNNIVNLWACGGSSSKQQQHAPTVEKQCHELLFSVDTTPSKGREIIAFPKYSTSNSSVIEIVDPNKPNGDALNSNKASTLVCFNCDGNHAMRDCKEMKDYRRISMARNKYMANAPAKTVRYHLDDEQKYKHLTPGKISEKLKKALNVRKHELPSYIYRMRMFGYPPGWLEEARVHNSTLELFDFQGCSVEESCNNKQIIDANKIIEYPGFNVPLEKGDIDDYKYYRCPAYSEQFSKKTMLEYIESYTRSQNVVNTVVKEAKVESDSNSQGSEIIDQSNINTDTNGNKNKRSASPTLNDLELRKRQLLAELEDGCTSSPQPVSSENNDTIKDNDIKNDEISEINIEQIPETKIDEISENKTDQILENKIDEIPENKTDQIPEDKIDEISEIQNVTKTEIPEIKQEISENINEDIAIADTTAENVETLVKNEEETIESPSVVSSTFGTPILKTASPFSQLPERDKWSKDISQVINFENLPNSTGKYEQMTKVINKVRSIVKGAVITDDENKS